MMLWTLLRGVAGRYSPSFLSGYGATELDDDDQTDPTTMRLDPVEVAGKANIEGVKRIVSPFVFAVRAILIISCLEVFLSEVQPPEGIRRIESNRWANHLKDLVAFKLISRDIEEGEVKGVSSYFAIPKQDMARAIFNGRVMSEQSAPPPGTNLPDVTAVLTQLAAMAYDGVPPVFLLGDIRHYFHQLSLSKRISAYFCVMFDRVFYRWRNVPMGHSWSPFIAQSLSMGILLACIGEHYDVSAYAKLKSPPSMILIRRNGALVLVGAVWYDNLLVCTKDHDTGRKLFSKIRRTFEDENECRIQLKEWNFFGPRSLAKGADLNLDDPNLDTSQPSYLGLNFARFRTSDHKGNCIPCLHWRIEKKRLLKWRALEPQIQPVMDCRTVARVCGAALWAQHIGLRPLCRSKQLIELVRICGTRARTRADWDAAHRWTEEQCETLRSALRVAYTSEWHTVHPREAERSIVVCTDSSGCRWGRVWWDQHKRLQEDIGGNWDSHMMPANIFCKELCAATMAIEHIAADTSLSGSHIRLLVDNSAAAAVLRRMVSSTSTGTEMAERCDRALTRSHCTLEVILITTDQNPADDPSRNRKVTAARIEKMWAAIAAADNGSHVDMDVRRNTKSGLRHEEIANVGDAYDDNSDLDPTDEWCFLDIAEPDTTTPSDTERSM